MFDPEISSEVVNSKPVPEMERLSTLYNADVGLYMLANKVIWAFFIVNNLSLLCYLGLCKAISVECFQKYV